MHKRNGQSSCETLQNNEAVSASFMALKGAKIMFNDLTINRSIDLPCSQNPSPKNNPL